MATCAYRGCDSEDTKYTEWKTVGQAFARQVTNHMHLCEPCYQKLLNTRPHYTAWPMGSRQHIEEIWLPEDNEEDDETLDSVS